MSKSDTTFKSLGHLAYESQKGAWPKYAEGYVTWENLTQSARDGWDYIANKVAEAVNDIR